MFHFFRLSSNVSFFCWHLLTGRNLELWKCWQLHEHAVREDKLECLWPWLHARLIKKIQSCINSHRSDNRSVCERCKHHQTRWTKYPEAADTRPKWMFDWIHRRLPVMTQRRRFDLKVNTPRQTWTAAAATRTMKEMKQPAATQLKFRS